MDFAAAYRKRAEALEAYLDQLFVKFETEREKRADEHLRSVFQNFDLDDSGAIDHYEFSRACERLNPTMSAEDLEDALSLIDGDGDGDISFDEFEKWWKSDHAITLREKADAELGKADEIDEVALVTRWETTRQRLEKEKLHRAFESIDEDGSGEIEFSEFRRLCRRMNAKMSDEEIKMTFAIVDADGSGEVDFEEFSVWWETEDGRRLRGEGEKPSSDDFTLQELIEAVEARMKDRQTEKQRESFARKQRLAKHQEGWDAVRAERRAIAEAKAAAIATEQRLQAASLEKLRQEEERQRREEEERQRKLQWEASQERLRTAREGEEAPGAQFTTQTSAGVVTWLPLEADTRQEPSYVARTASAASAQQQQVSQQQEQPKLRKSAARKPGEGNSSGNGKLRLLPVVGGVLKLG